MKKHVSWTELDYLVDRLATEIKISHNMDDNIPNEVYSGIYGIPRGGLIIAVMLSHRLGIPYNDRLQEMYGKRFLIIDDIADSGKTLERMKSEVYEHADIATLHYNMKESVVEPEHWIENKNNRWIVYPWEQDDSLEIQDYKL